MTFVNRTTETIWVAAAPDPSTPLAATGWVLPAGKSVTISTPNNLNTRFWGRTGRVFRNGVGHCQTGDRGGLFQCKGWGTIPATLAEVNFDAWDNLDFYDVSMVDGSNLPMYINITRSSGGTTDKISPDGCVPAGCTKAVQCPNVLDVKAGAARSSPVSPRAPDSAATSNVPSGTCIYIYGDIANFADNANQPWDLGTVNGPGVTLLPLRNTRYRVGLIRKHFHAIRAKYLLAEKCFQDHGLNRVSEARDNVIRVSGSVFRASCDG